MITVNERIIVATAANNSTKEGDDNSSEDNADKSNANRKINTQRQTDRQMKDEWPYSSR